MIGGSWVPSKLSQKFLLNMGARSRAIRGVRGNCTITHNQHNQHNQHNHTITLKNDTIKQKNSHFGQDDQCEIHNQHNQRNQHNQWDKTLKYTRIQNFNSQSKRTIKH